MSRTVVVSFVCSLCCSIALASNTEGSGVEVSMLLAQKDVNNSLTNRVDGTGCGCKKYQCGCCAHLKLAKIGLDDTVCTNLTYLPDQYGVSLTVSVDGKVYYNNTVSAKNPPPVCLAVPHLKEFAKLCLQLYNLNIAQHRFSGCVQIVAKLKGLVVEEFKLGCFKIPPSMQTKYLGSELGVVGSTHIQTAEKQEGAGCGCEGDECGCCADLVVKRFDFNHTVCTNLTYLPDQLGVSLTISVDGKVYYNNTVSARNPPPICFGIPHMHKLASICLVLYDLDIVQEKLTGCARIEATLAGAEVEHIDLGCFKIPPKQSKLIAKPVYHNGPLDSQPVQVLQSLSYKKIGCSCLFYDCGCCIDVIYHETPSAVCANLTFDVDTSDVEVLLTLDEKVFFNKTIQVRNPPPVCFQLPMGKDLEGCMQFYDLDIQDAKLTGCIRIMPKFDGVVVVTLDLGCFQFPSNPQDTVLRFQGKKQDGLSSHFERLLQRAFLDAKAARKFDVL